MRNPSSESSNLIKKPTQKRVGYLPTLDGWRALSILGVLLFHDNVHSFGPLSTQWVHKIGYLGVDLFFSISGFLITTRLLDEESKNGAFSIKGFYVRRAFRILPPALLYLFVTAILSLVGVIQVSRGGIVAALLFVRNFYAQYHHALPDKFTEHFWSLSIEEQFYIVSPSLLLLIVARRRRSLILGLLTAVFVAYAWLAPALLSDKFTFAFSTPMIVYGILFASFLAVLLGYPRIAALAQRYMHPYLVFTGLLIFKLLLRHHHPETFQICLILGFALVVISTTLHPDTFLGKFLEWKPLKLVGRMSYSIYLWQQLFFMDQRVFKTVPYPWMDRMPLSYILVLCCAAASFYLLEKPMIRFGHKFAPPATAGHRDLLVSEPR